MKIAHATVSIVLAASLAACGGDDPATLVASAKAYIAKRDYTAAIIEAKNALQKDPDHREARYVLGLASLEGGDIASAEQQLRKAIELGHGADEVQVALARTLFAKGDNAALVKQFGETRLSTPKAQADLLAIVGAAELRSNRRVEAQEAFKQALALDAGNAYALVGVARLAAAEQDWKRSAAAVDAALANSPLNTEALILKADLLETQGQNEAATKAYRAAVEASRAEMSARLSLIAHLVRQRALEAAATEVEALEKLAPKDVRTNYTKSALLVEQRKWKEARETLQHVLKRMPEHVPSLTMAGLAAFETGAYAEAESHLRRALFNAPTALAPKRILVATHLRMGQTDLALAEARELVARAPDNSIILALAGEAHLASGDVASAARYYERAKRAAPDNVRVQTRLAQVRFAAGDTSGGLSELEAAAAAAAGTEDHQAELALITTYLRQRQPDKALQALQALEKKQPDNPLISNLRGIALLLKKENAKARASFERALELRPTYMPAVINLARLDMRDRKPEAAKKRYEAVLAKEPQNERALLGLAVLMRVTGAPQAEIEKLLKRSLEANPSSPNARIALVNFHLRARDYKAALAAAQEARAALPNEPRIVGALGAAQLAAGETRQAVATLTRFAEMQPKSHQPLLLLASAHMRAEQPDEAIKALRAALLLRPDLASAQRDIAIIYAKTGRADQAIKEARGLQSDNPKQPFGYMLEGEIYAVQKKWDAAERVYRAAMQKFDTPVLAARTHAVMEQAGKPKEALALAEQWIAAHPQDTYLLNYLGGRDIGAKRYESAVKRYQNALKRAPDNALMLNNLAWAKHQLKQPSAREDAERAHELDPESPVIMDTLGVILVDSGELERGLELLGSAAESAPQAYEIRLNFAKALVKAKRKSSARKELEALAKLDSRNPIQQEAAKLLAGL